MHIPELLDLECDILVACNMSKYPADGSRDQVASHYKHLGDLLTSDADVDWRAHRAGLSEAAQKFMAEQTSDRHAAARLLMLWARLNLRCDSAANTPSSYLLEIIAVQAADAARGDARATLRLALERILACPTEVRNVRWCAVCRFLAHS